VACQWIKELSTHKQNHDRSAAAAVFVNGTYFLDTLRTSLNSEFEVYETFQKFPSLAVKKFPSQIALKTSH
jgi:hypothetical protein